MICNVVKRETNVTDRKHYGEKRTANVVKSSMNMVIQFWASKDKYKISDTKL